MGEGVGQAVRSITCSKRLSPSAPALCSCERRLKTSHLQSTAMHTRRACVCGVHGVVCARGALMARVALMACVRREGIERRHREGNGVEGVERA
jgi:hypothetical protein